mmetsp:Transcript_25646/g.79140  ORF Transcript_25646/g.79140 Transcript_25646/m.79140 type:complete len:206 (-) Transcript_25646:151-768(-)
MAPSTLFFAGTGSACDAIVTNGLGVALGRNGDENAGAETANGHQSKSATAPQCSADGTTGVSSFSANSKGLGPFPASDLYVGATSASDKGRAAYALVTLVLATKFSRRPLPIRSHTSSIACMCPGGMSKIDLFRGCGVGRCRRTGRYSSSSSTGTDATAVGWTEATLGDGPGPGPAATSPDPLCACLRCSCAAISRRNALKQMEQ